MKIKTSEATKEQLNWLVAKCEGRPWPDNAAKFLGEQYYCPSTDWAQGGPIIERERILIQPEIGKEGCGNAWNAISMRDTEAYGPTPLIAAMRCLVASKLGGEIEIPEELL